MRTTEAVVGRWPEVFEYFGLPPVTGKHHFKGECPLCRKTAKFRCDDKDGRGTWICNCDSGDGWKLLTLTKKKPIRELMDEVDRIIGNSFTPETRTEARQISTITQTREAVIRRFSTLESLRNTDGEVYLRSRGINVLPSSDAVRFCLSQRAANNGTFQAIWSLVTDSKANLCYLHRTLLEGGKKAGVDVAKKQKALQEKNVLDHAGTVAIRLFPVASTLGVAEGIETALSCKQVYGVNTWSVINAGFMAKFIAPAGVVHLIVFADMDPNSATGHSAAFSCARANLVAKNDIQKVTVRWPDSGDFNDLIMNGEQVRELIFTKKVVA